MFENVYRAPGGIKKNGIWISDNDTFGLSNLRTNGPSGYWAFGLSDRHQQMERKNIIISNSRQLLFLYVNVVKVSLKNQIVSL